MSLARALELARLGRLYPATILYGGDEGCRRAAAVALARTLLCAAESRERPCGRCRHCQRIVWPGGEEAGFHPDFIVLERDLKTSTSAEATRSSLRGVQLSPFEARGQVFAVAAAETLSAEAGDALLKALEEPSLSAPRHFLLLAPSRTDLPATLRSRSFSLFLGERSAPGADEVEPIAAAFRGALARFEASGGAGFYLLGAAAALARAGSWDDPRAERPWSVAAAAVRQAALAATGEPRRRAPLLALAQDLLEASPLRLRGIGAERILEGLVARRLAALQ